MKHTETVTINAMASQVWPFLADPVLQAAWNPKIVSIDRPADGPVQAGDHYDMIAKMSGKQSASHAEVIDVVPGKRLVIRHSVDGNDAVQMVTETYALNDKHNNTLVTQTIDLSATAIPWFMRPLIWFIMTFGRTTSEPQLHGLKRMVESEVGA